MAGDGAVIAANVGGDSSTANFQLYYWTNSGPITEPANVWTGDPSGQDTGLRFGDSLAVRGAGANTQVLLDNSTGTFGALLSPTAGHAITDTDSWSGDGAGNYAWFANVALGSTGGRTLLFYGTSATFWEKHGGAGTLNLLSYDATGAHTSAILTNYPNVTGSPTLVAFNAATNVLVAIDFASSSSVPDTLDQYDMSDPSQPLFVRSYNFPVNHQAQRQRLRPGDFRGRQGLRAGFEQWDGRLSAGAGFEHHAFRREHGPGLVGHHPRLHVDRDALALAADHMDERQHGNPCRRPILRYQHTVRHELVLPPEKVVQAIHAAAHAILANRAGMRLIGAV